MTVLVEWLVEVVWFGSVFFEVFGFFGCGPQEVWEPVFRAHTREDSQVSRTGNSGMGEGARKIFGKCRKIRGVGAP